MYRKAWRTSYFVFIGIASVLLLLRLTDTIPPPFGFVSSVFGFAACIAGFKWMRCEINGIR